MTIVPVNAEDTWLYKVISAPHREQDHYILSQNHQQNRQKLCFNQERKLWENCGQRGRKSRCGNMNVE